jgi:ABC-type molybdate transport system substrate-binding protein
MRASKGNKEYVIVESQQKSYQDSGFDIIDDDGDIIAYGRGKTVPYGDYAALKEELEALKAAGENADDQDVIDILKAFAHEKGIDLGKAATVPGIIKKIKEFNLEGGA